MVKVPIERALPPPARVLARSKRKRPEKAKSLAEAPLGPQTGARFAPRTQERSRSDAIAVRAGAFSRPPGELGALLREEIVHACTFVQEMKRALTFFGGARLIDGPYFEQGKIWGEALLLSNLLAAEPNLAARAIGKGVFSKEAMAAARASMLGAAAGRFGAERLASAVQGAGDAASPDALSGALARLALSDVDREAAKLLLSLRPRTGAGSGIMHAVPFGYVSARERVAALFDDPAVASLLHGMEAEGSRMSGNLPTEQKQSDAVEQMGYFPHFIPRRLALIEGSAGFAVFPGGIGTLNEVFEVLRAKKPLLFDGSAYWKDITDTLIEKWRSRGLVAEKELDCFHICDGVENGLPYLLEHADMSPPKGDLVEHGERMGKEIERGLKALAKQKPPVTFLGGRRLRAGDQEVRVAEALAEKLSGWKIPLRLGSDGALFDAVNRGAKKVEGAPRVHAILEDHGDVDYARLRRKTGRCDVVHSTNAHKILMYENTRAVVALPGGKGTFDEVFEVACLMETGNLAKRPLILVGRDFWQPFLDRCARVMDRDPGRTVEPNAFTKWFQVVDSAEEAERILSETR